MRLVDVAAAAGAAHQGAAKVLLDNTYCTPYERVAHGISDRLVRLSIGLEDIEDVPADITPALDEALVHDMAALRKATGRGLTPQVAMAAVE